jgi:polysaccharide export outer membrane protein
MHPTFSNYFAIAFRMISRNSPSFRSATILSVLGLVVATSTLSATAAAQSIGFPMQFRGTKPTTQIPQQATNVPAIGQPSGPAISGNSQQYIPVNLPDTVLPSGAVVGTPASPRSPAGHLQPMENHIGKHVGIQSPPTAHIGNANHCECQHCARGGSQNFIPPAMLAPIPPQSRTLTSGASQPCIQGIDSADDYGPESLRWQDSKQLDFQPLYQGEWIGPVRLPSFLEYRVRVGDQIDFLYLITREQQPNYRIQVGDEVIVESTTDKDVGRGTLEKGLAVQSDGCIYVPMVGAIRAAGLTWERLAEEVELAYTQFLKNPSISVLPVKSNTALLDLQATVDNRFGNGGLAQLTSVNPDGRINLPLIGSVYVHGLSLDEIRREVNLKYREKIRGVELEPRLATPAPKFVYVLGEVAQPGRYEMTQSTSVSQALALAGGINVGANHREIVVFRRAEDWRLVSTMLDLRGAHLGRSPNPSDQIWMRDNDLIIVPPMPIKLFDNFVRQVFVEGIYGIVPFGGISYNFGDNAF